MGALLREEYETINGRLLAAQKAVRERERILSLMASLDESLVKEQGMLDNLMTQLDEAKVRLEQLEGMTITAVWQKIIGSYEAELTQEAESYAELKMAHEASQMTIQSITNSFLEFEVALVDLAECDEELTAVQAEQQAFLAENGRLPAAQIHQLNQEISEGQTFLHEAYEALAIGKKALQAITSLLESLESAKIRYLRASHTDQQYRFGLTYTGMGVIVMAASEAQPLLTLFQFELSDIGMEMVRSPDLAIPAYREVMAGISSAETEMLRTKRIQIWKTHLESWQEYLKRKIDTLAYKCGQKETAVQHAQSKLATLIKQKWQKGEATIE